MPHSKEQEFSLGIYKSAQQQQQYIRMWLLFLTVYSDCAYITAAYVIVMNL